ncbi:MAG: Gfo/Idh/MocA family oxidoreductase [Prolixibacteraceae bacterium]|mgnify:CR=1 FL=1|nr:Gfo/Idh/MocA family oxidoreductase [Prolixibacteraceae bacterium]MBT6764845.1 Gfo/Idh/MocA family oxidoreductase [Prolixibacteraceae bacterium]MBT6998123.1 Gfo/Idh/MocA family oxidoreductase [Prolixibacteraceae bacterium]MBT7393939.1 Gfo/Idh/MocA family oxidoreductase [Prolixibacteraceae bacterium]
MKKNTRREFITKSTTAVAGVSVGLNAFSSAQTSRIFGANDKVRMGFIGIGNRGSQLLNLFMQNKNCEVAALCDVYEPYTTRDRSQVSPRFTELLGGRIPKMGEKFPKQPKIYNDYQKLLEDKDIDGVCIATPDHWHALQTVHSIQAGKDIYVEKPLTATIYEGRKMVETQATSKQVVAVGLNRRGSSVYQKLAKDIPNGKIGKVTVARAARVSNMFPNGIGKMAPEQPPKDFNWDMWLGPRGIRPYQYNIAPYYFRWWSDFSSQMGNWGVHYMDVIRWMLGETAPVAISANGGKYALDHDGDIPDTMQVCFEFASGSMISFSIYEGGSGKLFPYGELELMGTKGNLYANERGYQIIPAKSGQFQTWENLIEPEEFDNPNRNLDDGSSADSTSGLIGNFLDCVKSRETPLCTLEDGHRSTSFAHLANIALATKERLQWDSVNEKFTNSKEANKLLSYEYRKPWKL